MGLNELKFMSKIYSSAASTEDMPRREGEEGDNRNEDALEFFQMYGDSSDEE